MRARRVEPRIVDLGSIASLLEFEGGGPQRRHTDLACRHSFTRARLTVCGTTRSRYDL